MIALAIILLLAQLHRYTEAVRGLKGENMRSRKKGGRRALLAESGIAWLTFTSREHHQRRPGAAFLNGADVTWHSAFIICATAAPWLVVGSMTARRRWPPALRRGDRLRPPASASRSRSDAPARPRPSSP